MDCELVITAVQLNVPLPPVGQPARRDPWKCAYVSYADSPSPMTASTSVVSCSQAGGPAGRSGAMGSAATAVSCGFSACAPAVCGRADAACALAAGALAVWAPCGCCPCCCSGAAVRAAG